MANVARRGLLLFIHDLNTFYFCNINDHNPKRPDSGMVKSQIIRSSFANSKLCYLGQITYELSAQGFVFVFFFFFPC